MEPYIDTGVYTVNEDAPVERVHRLFRSMGLRHLIVTNSANFVVGMITRKDLIAGGRAQVRVQLQPAIRQGTMIKRGRGR